MRYRIVEADNAKELQQKVQAALDKGWELQGGVVVATVATGEEWEGQWYFQAMVRGQETE